MSTIVFRPPTADDLAAIAARWATRDGTFEDETIVNISNLDPDTFSIWSGRGPDIRAILRRAAGRILELEERPHGIEFTFARSTMSGAGAAAILASPARQAASRGRRPGFAPSLTESTDATDDEGGSS